jgi:hypothetical protein
MLNNLQTHPNTFVHIPKINFFQRVMSCGTWFFGSTSPKTKVGAFKNNTGQTEPAVQELPLTSTAGNLQEKAQLVADSAKLTTRLA